MSDENQNQPPPPPSDDGGAYEQEGYQPDVPPTEESYAVDSGPAVANTANKNLILVLVGGALGLFLLYQILSGDDEPEVVSAPIQTAANSQQGATVAAAEEIPIPTAPIEAPPLPPPPPLPTAEPEPLPPPPQLTDPDIDFLGEGPSNEEQKQRRTSEMLILNNAKPEEDEEDSTGVTSQAPRAVATHVGNLDSLILQGKIIDAVLETAIDTTLAGPIRGIVSRDIYAESGYGVLIPKGSRLIGTYDTNITRGQGRVLIAWERVIRPDGIDVKIESQGIDRLGRSGMTGHVDNRYFEIFGGAVLTSIISIAIAGIADAITDPEPTTTTQTPEGGSTTTGSSVDTAITESVENIGSVSQRVIGGLLDVRPKITVDQGTPIKVYVNQDLEFPENITNGNIRIIQ